MQKAVVAAGLLIFLPLSLRGQSNQNPHPTPKAELFGGYSLVHLEGTSMNGWNASLAGNFNRNLGIVGDVGAHYNRESSRGLAGTAKSSLTFHTFLAGPRITERKYKWLTPYAHALFGYARVNAKLTQTQSGAPTLSVRNDVNGFAMALGGGLDINGDERYFIRLLQADYFLIRSDRIKHEGLRISAGVLVRFGRREE